MYNMLLEISTELDSIKAMLQKSESTHLLEFQNFLLPANKEMRSQKYYVSFNLTLSYCYGLKVSRSIKKIILVLIICFIKCLIVCFDHLFDLLLDCLFDHVFDHCDFLFDCFVHLSDRLFICDFADKKLPRQESALDLNHSSQSLGQMVEQVMTMMMMVMVMVMRVMMLMMLSGMMLMKMMIMVLKMRMMMVMVF